MINYFKKFIKSKLNVENDIYNVARYKLQKIIFNKNRLENKLTQSIGKSKDLVKVLKINNTVEHVNSVLEGVKK